MVFAIRKAAVGLIALATSIIPVVEIGIFGYETWETNQDRSAAHAEAGEDLAGFREDLELQALANAQMEPGPDKQWAVDNWNQARGYYEEARDHWQAQDYVAMAASIGHGQDAMAGLASDGSAMAGFQEVIDDPAFPLLASMAAGLVAVVAWGAYMGIRPEAPAHQAADQKPRVGRRT